MTDGYDADRLERDLNATIVTYRRWLNNRDSWTGFDDGPRRDRLRSLATEAAGVIEDLASGPAPETEEPQEFSGTVETADGSSFATYAYFEEGQLVVADDDDEEWLVDLADIRKDGGGFVFPDHDGSDVRFVPTAADGFSSALDAARAG